MEVETISEGKVLCIIMIRIQKMGEALFLNIGNGSISERSEKESYLSCWLNISSPPQYPSRGPGGKVHLN